VGARENGKINWPMSGLDRKIIVSRGSAMVGSEKRRKRNMGWCVWGEGEKARSMYNWANRGRKS